MLKYLQWVAGVLFVVALTTDFLLYGGIVATPRVGEAFTAAVREDGDFLDSSYLAGGHALIAVGLADTARAFAQRRVGDSYPRIAEQPSAALRIVAASRRGWVDTAHYAAPLLLLLAAMLALLRPRPIRTIGR